MCGMIYWLIQCTDYSNCCNGYFLIWNKYTCYFPAVPISLHLGLNEKFSDKDAMEQIPLEAFQVQLYQREREITSGCNLNSIWIWVAPNANHSLQKTDESTTALIFHTCLDTSPWISPWNKQEHTRANALKMIDAFFKLI